MSVLDLVEQANFNTAKDKARTIFNQLDDAGKLALCRDLAIDQISETLDKFPVKTQREILALLAHKYLTQWSNNDKS